MNDQNIEIPKRQCKNNTSGPGGGPRRSRRNHQQLGTTPDHLGGNIASQNAESLPAGGVVGEVEQRGYQPLNGGVRNDEVWAEESLLPADSSLLDRSTEVNVHNNFDQNLNKADLRKANGSSEEDKNDIKIKNNINTGAYVHVNFDQDSNKADLRKANGSSEEDKNDIKTKNNINTGAYVHVNFDQDSNRQTRSLNVAIGIVVKDRRKESAKLDDNNNTSCPDEDYIRGISEALSCLPEDIHLLNAKTKFATVENIQKFIIDITASYSDVNIENCYLFLSSHGSKSGFMACDGNYITLKNLVQPLIKFGNQVLVFYHACRGDERIKFNKDVNNKTSDMNIRCSWDCGCCLPREGYENCAVIYSSQSGFISGFYDDCDSIFFNSLYNIFCIDKDFFPTMLVKELVRKTQNEIIRLYPDGIRIPKKDKKDPEIVSFQIVCANRNFLLKQSVH